MQVQPYLLFPGTCEQAVRYYEKHLGARVQTLFRYEDAPPGASPPHANGRQVMHCKFALGSSELMASDDCYNPGVQQQGVSLSLTADNQAQAEQWFAALADGGDIKMPLGPTFFSPCFGVLVDRFGVSWMIMLYPPAEAP